MIRSQLQKERGDNGEKKRIIDEEGPTARNLATQKREGVHFTEKGSG